MGVRKKTICPGGEIGRRKGLKILSTRFGNSWCEWCQIRGNLSGMLMAIPSEARILFGNV